MMTAGAALALAASLVTACGSDATATGGESTSGDGASSAQHETGDKSVTIPIAGGWAEDIAVTHLWKYVLSDHGYTVETPTLDIAPIFKGVAAGDYDLFFDVALPNTHADYWKKFGDKIDDLGAWYDKTQNTLVVPDYMDIDSISDLKSIGDEVDKTIIGIDPGAGLTHMTQTNMMPAYGLDKAGWTLKTSSTPAMLAALQKAVKDHKPIVVTLWHPHWAYSVYDLKDLKDPKVGMGEPDHTHKVASKDFAASHADLIAKVKKFHMDPDLLSSLEKVVLQDYGDGKYQQGVEAWAKDHQDFVDGMLG
jgi:glycine betaine/proline transport system substrate-binding protein